MGAVGSDGKIGRRGLNAVECVNIIKLLNPYLIIPVHHTTFSHYVEHIYVLQKSLKKTKHKSKLKLVKEGTTIKLENKMISADSKPSHVSQKYFTKESDVKKSSIIQLTPHSTFVPEKERQSDIYIIEGSCTIAGEVFERRTYIGST